MSEYESQNNRTPDWTRIAVGLALLMLTYLTLTNHVRLYPLNNLAATDSLWPSTLIAWAQFAIFIGLILTRRPFLTFAALIFSIVWLALQFNQWYVPYLFGMGDTAWFFENGYDATLKILPSLPRRVVTPDLQHNVLQFLSALVIVSAALALRRSRNGDSVQTDATPVKRSLARGESH